ncbi:hypothetical protein ACJMK2_039780 [Sinanodonta woodiana]|uniref:RING-type domain-containing protein n=1 Tax=Sinanodonta woodiana TaxID=1069815 RepID=A0ABD3WGD8_SINWO
MVNVNYEVVSSVLNCLWSVCSYLYVAIVFTLRFLVTVIQCLEDFLQEVFVIARALFFLLWKLIILAFSLASLLLHALEAAVYFVWTGGKWTAETIKISAYSLAENGMGTWDYIVVSVKEFSNSLCGGFTIVGNLGMNVVIFVWEGLFWIYEMFNFIIDAIDMFVRRICSEVIEILYQFVVNDLVNIPKETYIGIGICVCSFVFMKGIFNILGSRGMMSPFSYLFSSSSTARNFEFPVDDEVTMEFSDDDFEVESNESFGEGEEFTVDEEGTEDETDSDMNEIEDSDNDDDDDNDDTARSESDTSEINIELPTTVNGYYNLRRSETPSRKNVTNMKDLEKEVERERERRKCVVCQDRSKSVLILPCKHMCLCVECGNQIARHRVANRRICPLCRQKIRTIMNVYV